MTTIEGDGTTTSNGAETEDATGRRPRTRRAEDANDATVDGVGTSGVGRTIGGVKEVDAAGDARGTKRGAPSEDAEGANASVPRTKRRRWEDGSGENAETPSERAVEEKPRVKPKLDKAALLKQKEALLKQKELAAKLKAKKEADEAKKASAVSGRPRAAPMALRLDAQGREVDERGNLVVHKVIESSALSANLKQQRAAAFAQAQAQAQAEMVAQIGSEYDDPRMRAFSGRSRKARSTLQVRFVPRVEDLFFLLQRIFQSSEVNLTKCPLETTRMLQRKACALILAGVYSLTWVTLRRYIRFHTRLFFCASKRKLHSVVRPLHVTLQFLGLRHQTADRICRRGRCF